jgi:hypothetical protein
VSVRNSEYDTHTTVALALPACHVGRSSRRATVS